jgi:hypothetical protein
LGSSSIWTESLTVGLAVGVGAGVGLGIVVALTWRVALAVADAAFADVRSGEPWPQDTRSRRRNGSRS